MKIIPYAGVDAVQLENDQAKGITVRVVIGKADGAQNFCMRVLEIAAGGYTPKHVHDWEHEMFFHAGAGEVYCRGRWNPVGAGSVAFIPAKEEHQIRNAGPEVLILACLVPSSAPEL